MNQPSDDIDAYLKKFPVRVRKTLKELRRAIRKAAPQATEKIAYGIPTFVFHGNLVHFAAFQSHIGFYPAASGIRAFKKELSKYELARGTVRFPIEKRLPLGLIQRIVRFRVKQNQRRLKNFCRRGHRFSKSASRPVCPACWPNYYRRK